MELNISMLLVQQWFFLLFFMYRKYNVPTFSKEPIFRQTTSKEITWMTWVSLFFSFLIYLLKSWSSIFRCLWCNSDIFYYFLYSENEMYQPFSVESIFIFLDTIQWMTSQLKTYNSFDTNILLHGKNGRMYTLLLSLKFSLASKAWSFVFFQQTEVKFNIIPTLRILNSQMHKIFS